MERGGGWRKGRKERGEGSERRMKKRRKMEMEDIGNRKKS